MKEESDLIQSTARSYGESICLQQFILNLHALKCLKSQEMFTKLAILYALNSIQKDLAWFMAEGVFSQNSNFYQNFMAQYDAAVVAVASISMDAVSAFDVREEMLHAPIATDWIQYNTYDNQGKCLIEKIMILLLF